MRWGESTLLCIASPDPVLRGRLARALGAEERTVVEASTLDELRARATGGLGCAVVDPRLPGLEGDPAGLLRAEPGLHGTVLSLLGEREIDAVSAVDQSRDLIHLVSGVERRLAMRAQLSVLERVTARLAAAPDLDTIIEEAFEELRSRIDFDTATLFLRDETGNLFVRAALGYALEPHQMRSFRPDEGVVGWVVTHRSPAIVGDSEMDRRFAPLGGRTPRSMLALPTVVADVVVGAITLVRLKPAPAFDDGEMALAAVVTGCAATALDNHRLRERDREVEMRREELQRLRAVQHELLERYQEYEEDWRTILATAAHEMKTPLTGIRGFAQLIAAGDVTGEEARDSARQIMSDAVRLARYVDKMLDDDAQRHALGPRTSVRVRPLVDEAMRSVAGAATPGHLLVNEVPDDLPPASADPDELSEIIVNLLSNAVKYSPKGGRVTVNAFTVEEGMEITVSDEGMGIPEDQLSRVFDRYFRVSTSETRGVSGHGLGLSIVKRLVDLQGGRVWVEPLERGTCFHVALSVAGQEEDADGGIGAELDPGPSSRPVLSETTRPLGAESRR